MDSTDFDLLSFLEWLDTKVNLGSPLKSQVGTLRLRASFLDIFLSSSGKWHIEDGNLKVLLIRIKSVFQNANLEFRSLFVDLERLWDDLDLDTPVCQDVVFPRNMEDRLSRTLQRLQLLTLDIRQVYTILSKSSRSIVDLDSEAAPELLERCMKFLLRYKAEFVAPVRRELEAVRESLKFFTNFLGFAVEKCSNLGKLKHLLIHSEFLVDNISCLLYLCSVDEKMNDPLVTEMRVKLSSELQKINPAEPEVGKMYIKALRTSKSEGGMFHLDLFDSFLNYLLKLSSMTSNKSQIKFLYEEVQFLCIFLNESSVQNQKWNILRESIIAVIIDITCAIINLLHNDEQNRDEVIEVMMAVYDLQHIFMLKRENATKADFIYLRTSWRFIGPNTWGGIGSQLEFLEKMLLDVHIGPLKNQIKLIHKELVPLNKAFDSIQTELNEELEIQRRRLIRIIDRTNFVTTSFKYRVVALWSCNLELYYVIKNIRMIKMEVANIINRCTDDTETFEDEQQSNGYKKARVLSMVGMLEFEDQLWCFETNTDLISPLRDEVRILRLKASFLRVFLSCRGKWHIEDRNLKRTLTHIQTVLQNLDLRELWEDFIHIEWTECWGMMMNMEHVFSIMQERLQVLNPDIQQVYSILTKSSRLITGMTDGAVTESINSLLEGIKELLRFDIELISPVKEDLEAVENRLRFLRDLLCFTAKRCQKLGKLKNLLIHSEFLVDNISCLIYLFPINDMLNDQMVKEMKMQLPSVLQKFSPAHPDVREIYIKALKASNSAQENSTLVDECWGFLDFLGDYIMVLSDTKMWSTPFKDKILLLQEDLPFLITYFAMDLSWEEHHENDHQLYKDLLERTSAVISETKYIIGSLHDDKQNDIYKKFLDFLVRKFYDLYCPSSYRSNFPRTNGQGFISYLLGNLKELLNTEADMVAPLKHQIEIVQEELLSLMENFSKNEKQANQCEELQSQWTRLIATAYHVEYVTDSFVAGLCTLSSYKLGLVIVLDEIKTIKMELNAIGSKTIDVESVYKPPNQFSTEVNLPKIGVEPSSNQRLTDKKYTSELMIFPKVAQEIIEQLTYGSKKLSFLSIVGMPGIGKTTLANSVFQDSSVTHRFHVSARCSISQIYDKRRLLGELLQEITGENDQYEDENDLEKKLYQILKGRRYLIFMDDIWDIRPWGEIRNSFPDDENGSRIIFTSRFDNIASQTGPNSINYPLSPLSEEKSWKMLESKVFGNGTCPNDLVNLGCEIAANCKGLPLTVDLIAGILRGKEMIVWEWKKVADSIKEYLQDPQGRCQKVLELGYQNLPDELRPCFLYFAAFPEDTIIHTRDLLLLWIAEGFVQPQKNDRRCLEDAAEKILNDLIGRSIVIVSKRRRLGGVKATCIHDLLHNFASVKAKEEKFMLKIHGKSNFSTSSSDAYQWRGQYRLCIYPDNRHQFLESILPGTCARALICCEDLYVSFNSLQFSYFKLLRVLYIPRVIFHHHPTTIFELIHLRFLVICSTEIKILSEVHKLRNLETLIIMNDRFSPKGCLFLHEICNMRRLRYLHFRFYNALQCCKEKNLEKSFLFDNLRTLYHVKVQYPDAERILKLMPNLVKLKIQFYNHDGDCYHFPKLDFLKKLESLHVMHSPRKYPCKFINFPSNLKTLVLSELHLPWTEISKIGKLEKLEILKLKFGAFEGAIWDMNDGQFPKLKYLSLYGLDIEEWNTKEDHLSCLEQLHLGFCEKLKELPQCLAEVATLQKIKLYHCLSSAESSAKIIEEEQQGIGNYQLVVEIEKTYVESHVSYVYGQIVNDMDWSDPPSES